MNSRKHIAKVLQTESAHRGWFLVFSLREGNQAPLPEMAEPLQPTRSRVAWSKLGGPDNGRALRCRRAAKLKEEIINAAGSGNVGEMVPALLHTLRSLEGDAPGLVSRLQHELSDDKATTARDSFFKQVCPAFSELRTALPNKYKSWVDGAMYMALTSKSKELVKHGYWVATKTWKRMKANIAGGIAQLKELVQKGNAGRPRLDLTGLGAALQTCSRDTVDWIRFKGELLEKRCLTKSMRRVWLTENSAAAACSMRTMYRRAPREFRHICKAQQESDWCGICVDFEKKVRPRAEAVKTLPENMPP